MEWISVKDRLPEKAGQYLVVAAGVRLKAGVAVKGNGIFLGYYSDKYQAWVIELKIVNCVTHWMPLPDLPQQEKPE